MANNRWQIGIAGNYANDDDEAVRLAILEAQQQLGCSTSEAVKHLILRAKSLLRLDVATHENANAPVDFSIVVETLNQGFSMLAGKLDNINVVQHSETKSVQSVAYDTTQAFKVVNSVTGAEETIDVERVPVDINSVFAAQVKKAARPGMRLES